MPVSVSIEPFSPSIDMYGSPDTCSAYSLSGHIIISLTPSSSILGLSRSTFQNLLLTDLELTFEGQSELILEDVGYTPLRLISLSKQLVSASHPVPISITDDEDRAVWRVVFDLSVPGWLPATSVFGDDDQRTAGVSYALYARARFLPTDLDDTLAAPPAPSSVWNILCAALRLAPSRPRSVQAARVPILLTRFFTPPHSDAVAEADFPRTAYAIHVSDSTSDSNIPADVLRNFQVQVITPSRTSVADSSVPLVLRMRAADNNHLRVLGFESDVVQVENFLSISLSFTFIHSHESPGPNRTSPSASYRARFPLPLSSLQPPNKPLRAPHPIGALWELGLIGAPTQNAHITRERSLVPSGGSKLFRVRGSDTDAHTHGVPLEDEWLRMEANIPVSEIKKLTAESPFFVVRHELRIRLSVGYEDEGEGAATTSDDLVFCVPLEFVRPAPFLLQHAVGLSTASLPLPLPRTRAPSPVRPLSALGTPPVPALPAYSQLFYKNGDRKDEGRLPLYREKEEAREEETDSSTSSRSPLTLEPYPPVMPDFSLPTDSLLTPSSPLTPSIPPGLIEARTYTKVRGEFSDI